MAKTKTHIDGGMGRGPACGAKSKRATLDWNEVDCKTCLQWEGSDFLPTLPPPRDAQLPHDAPEGADDHELTDDGYGEMVANAVFGPADPEDVMHALDDEDGPMCGGTAGPNCTDLWKHVTCPACLKFVPMDEVEPIRETIDANGDTIELNGVQIQPDAFMSPAELEGSIGATLKPGDVVQSVTLASDGKMGEVVLRRPLKPAAAHGDTCEHCGQKIRRARAPRKPETPTVEIAVGQVWRDMDARHGDRHVLVLTWHEETVVVANRETRRVSNVKRSSFLRGYAFTGETLPMVVAESGGKSTHYVAGP